MRFKNSVLLSFFLVICLGCKYPLPNKELKVSLLKQSNTPPLEFKTIELTKSGSFAQKLILVLDVFNVPLALPSCMSHMDPLIKIGYAKCVVPNLEKTKDLFIAHVYQECITNQAFEKKYPTEFFSFSGCNKAQLFIYQFTPPLNLIVEPIFIVK